MPSHQHELLLLNCLLRGELQQVECGALAVVLVGDTWYERKTDVLQASLSAALGGRGRVPSFGNAVTLTSMAIDVTEAIVPKMAPGHSRPWQYRRKHPQEESSIVPRPLLPHRRRHRISRLPTLLWVPVACVVLRGRRAEKDGPDGEARLDHLEV